MHKVKGRRLVNGNSSSLIDSFVAFQGGHEQLLKMMEERMMDVEQKLRLVKRLLQDKVNQLKEQVSILALFPTLPHCFCKQLGELKPPNHSC